MKAMGKVIAGGLLSCLAAIVASGPAAAGESDAPGAAAGAPQEHAWDKDGDGDRHGGWQHDGAGQHRWHHHHGGVAAMFRELGLTDAQRAKVKSIVEAARPAMQDLRDQLQANARTLRQTSPDDKNYSQVVAKISQENGALVSKLTTQRSGLYAQCYAQLAPIQKTRLAELLARHEKMLQEHKERMEHMQEHMHQHMDGPDPHSGGATNRPPPPPAQ